LKTYHDIDFRDLCIELAHRLSHGMGEYEIAVSRETEDQDSLITQLFQMLRDGT